MNLLVTDLAAAKLRWLLLQEGESLAVRVIPRTSGCGTASFALELTEIKPGFETAEIKGVLFAWSPSEEGWLNGLEIDLDRETGKFSLFHPRPPFSPDCPLPSK
jgi:Fe-S cluster assembly iron-binding protein IscA